MIKKYAKNIFCIFSVCLCFLTTVLCPSDVFLADESVMTGEVTTYSKTFSISDALYNINSNIAQVPDESTHPAGTNLVYWYNLYEYSQIFLTSKDVYAYRIVASLSGVSVTYRDLHTLNLVYGGAEDFGLVEDMNIGLSMLAGGSADYWYVNDYAVQPFYVGALALYAGSNATAATLDYTGNLTFTVVPYTMDDMVDEIYEELLELVEGQDDIYDELVKIYESSSSIEDKVTTIRAYVMNISSALPVISGQLTTIDKSLQSIQSTLDDMYSEQQKQTSWLEKLWNSFQEFLGLSGDNSDQYDAPIEDTEMDNLEQKEDDLLDETNPEDAADDLKVELDADASAFIWDTIDAFVTSNDTVFGLFISVLSLGVVVLILGR